MLQPIKRFISRRPILETAVKQLEEYGYTADNLQEACKANDLPASEGPELFPRAGHHIFEFQISEWNTQTSLIEFDEEKFKALKPHQRLEYVLVERFRSIEEYRDIIHQAWALSFSPINISVSMARLNQTIDTIQEASDTFNRYGSCSLKGLYLSTHLYMMNDPDWEDFLKRSINCLEENLGTIEYMSAINDTFLGFLGMFGIYRR